MKYITKILLIVLCLVVFIIPLSILGSTVVRAETELGYEVIAPQGNSYNQYSRQPWRYVDDFISIYLNSGSSSVESVSNVNRNKQEISADKLVLGGTYTLESGEVLNGNLFILGGIATIEEGAVVENDVVLLGGTADINGVIRGEVIVLGGLLVLGPSSVVEGDVNIIGGHVDKNSGAQVYGEENTGIEGPFSITVPGGVRVPIPGGENFPIIRIKTSPVWEGLWVLFRSFLMAGLAVLAVLFVPRQAERVGGVAVKQAPVSVGVGCLTVFAVPIVLVITAITIIGIPVTIAVAILFILVAIYGAIALGTETGIRLAKLFNSDWAIAVSAGVGTFLVWLIVEGINWIIPCVGGLPMALVVLLGIGAVILTRFGTRDYPYYSPESEPSRVNQLPPEELEQTQTRVISEEEALPPVDAQLNDIDENNHTDSGGEN